MGSSLAWLRVLVVAQWALLAAGVAVEAWFDEAFRNGASRVFVCGLESYCGGKALLIARIAGGALRLLGSAGILSGWARARIPYTLGVLALLALAPFGETRVPTAWAQPLYAGVWLAIGGVLALLWLPLTNVPTTDSRSAGSGALRTIALLALGGLALVGAVAVLGGFLMYGVISEATSADEAARSFGASTDDAGCLTAARTREGDDGSWYEGSFLYACLQTAKTTEAFCEDVPPIGPEADWHETPWTTERCKDDPRRERCEMILYTVQTHCDERR
jgi:hypothetical protein